MCGEASTGLSPQRKDSHARPLHSANFRLDPSADLRWRSRTMKSDTIRWDGDELRGTATILGQTRLPSAEVWLEIRTMEGMAEAIQRLAVRGAPALGVAGAYGL